MARGGSSTISDVLIRRNVIDAEGLTAAAELAKKDGIRLEKYLVDNKLASSDEVTLAISDYLTIPPISLANFTPSSLLLEVVTKETLTRHKVFPIAKTANMLTVAMGDPFDIMALDDLQMQTGLDIMPLVASEQDVRAALERAFANSGDDVDIEELLREADPDLEIGHDSGEDVQDESIEAMLESAEGAPVIRMVNMLLLEALRIGASDIHLEPMEYKLRLRYRVDGSLMESPSPPKNLQGAVLSRIKLMSGMDIAERRRPQDGRIKIKAMNKEVDLRVNTLPTIFGEKIVMRILDKSALFPNLAALNLDPEAHRCMTAAIEEPNGVIYVTGPTGSGKTTTLYSCLMELNRPDTNIITCEDPVEYQLDGINQVQINAFVGLTFGAALRSILRQSPDIILVGETRDSETAAMAVKAALTGHLVLSTLHTNDAAGAITRLIDMGVEPSLIASSLILAQAQRLVRRLCPGCRKVQKELPIKKLKTYDVDPAMFDDKTIYEKGGCPKCNGSGHKGRLAIMEVMPLTREIRRDIIAGATSKEIGIKAVTNGMLSLKHISMLKVIEGLTSIDAALAVTGGE